MTDIVTACASTAGIGKDGERALSGIKTSTLTCVRGAASGGDEHCSGIHVAKNPKSHELKCSGQHGYPRDVKVMIAKHEASQK